jgi:hypothetical protein
MKRLIIFAFLFTTVHLSHGQTNESELKSKKGHYILPQSGDWGLGIGSESIFNYFGRMFTPANQPPAFDFPLGDQTIHGKYFRERDFAYRGSIRISTIISTNNTYTPNLATDAEPGSLVINSERFTQFGTTLRLGFEKRRGMGRLQGIYGAELLLGYWQNGNTSYTYGNTIELQPTTIRTIKSNNGNTLSVGASGFVGVEYFFAPKMSFGGEFHWGPQYNNGSGTTLEREYWNATDNIAESETLNLTPGSSSFIMDNSTLGGLIKLMFYF